MPLDGMTIGWEKFVRDTEKKIKLPAFIFRAVFFSFFSFLGNKYVIKGRGKDWLVRNRFVIELHISPVLLFEISL